MALSGAAFALTACAQAAQPAPTPSTSQTPPQAGLERFYGQQLDWQSCGENECARLTVPVDYARPDGPTLELSVLRIPARGDSVGSLVLDPGGPGSSGTEYAAAGSYVVSDEVLDRFDVVGFDPRGVGASAPVQCGTDAQIDSLIDADGTPDDAAEETRLATLSEEFIASCSAPVEGLLDHLSTAEAARDMDVLRAALGENRLNYLGVSYGTHLGATYAAIFPERVGRFVLDGPLPAELTAEELTLEQGRGFEDAIRRFIDDCLTQSDCPFDGQTSPAALTELRTLLGNLDATPAPTANADRPLTEGAATYAVLMMMYAPDSDWPRLRTALGDLRAGDGTALQTLLDERMRRRADGTYGDNSTEAFYAISCTDRPVSGGLDAARELSVEWQTELPVLGKYLAWGNLPCASWPHAQVPPSLPEKSLPPILVVATTHDPATPLPWGEVLAEQLGSGILLVRDGDGHTAYREGSTCIDDAIDAFLFDGVLPEPGTVCR